MDKGPCIVFCTCPDADTASRIAEALVTETLAACVNLVPGLTSVYHWGDRLQRDAETLLLIKTRTACLPMLETRLRALHPYAVPEIVAVPIIGGGADYLAWLSANVGPAP